MKSSILQSTRLEKAIKLCKNDTAHIALNELANLVEEGCDEALVYVGNIYELGSKHVERNVANAVLNYKKSIKRTGSFAAYLGLARIHFNSPDSNHDCHKTLKYCEIVAKNISHPEAYYYMGRVYLEGCCVEKNLKKSEAFFRKSWKSGDALGLLFLGYVEKITGRKLIGLIHRLRAAYLLYREKQTIEMQN